MKPRGAQHGLLNLEKIMPAIIRSHLAPREWRKFSFTKKGFLCCG
jgi:hypothetical protein